MALPKTVAPSQELAALRQRIEELEAALADERRRPETPVQRGREGQDGGQVYHDLAELSSDAILIHDARNRIVFINQPGLAMFGAADSAAVLGRHILTLVHPESQREVAARALRLIGGAEVAGYAEQRWRRLDGGDCLAEVAAKSTTWEGRPAVLVVVRDLAERILARRQAEAADLRSKTLEERLLDAIEAMSEGFALFDAEDRLVLFNRRYGEDIWPQLADILKPGVTFERLIQTAYARGLWAGSDLDKETLLELARARHRRLPSAAEVVFPDGRCLRMTKRRTSDGGIVAMYVDISEAKEQEQRVREREERHRRLLETLPDAVVIHSGGKIAYVNPAAVRLFNAKTHQDLVGRTSLDLVHPADRLRQQTCFEEVSSTRRALPPSEQRRIRLDGGEVWVETRCAFIVWNGKPAFLGVLRDLTERKRAEAALAETERRFSAVAANMPGAVFQRVLHPDGSLSYPYISQGVRETHGMEAADVMRAPESFQRLIHPEDEPWFTAALERSARELSPMDIEVRNTRPNGEIAWIRSTARPHRRSDGAVVWDGIFVDTTRNKLIEQALRESEETARALVDAVTDYAVLLDRDMKILAINKPLAREWKSKPQKLVGKSLYDVAPAEVRDVTRENWCKAVGSGKSVQLESQRRGRWYHSSYHPVLDGDGKPTRLAILSRDITEQKEAQHKLHEAKEAAEMANRTKSEFLANMSHELRTPLNAVIGFSEILREEMFGPLGNPNYADYVNDIHESGIHLLEVINDILDISKIEAGKLTPTMRDIDPRNAIESSVRIVKGRADMEGIYISTRIAGELPPVRADERMLKQIVMNLLSNAVKFTPEGGRVRVTAKRARDGGLVVRVIDTGIGIAKDDISMVLAPFGQVESSLSRRYRGTGLGLPLVRSFLDLHDGRLTLRSRPGVGTCVSAWFPPLPAEKPLRIA